MAIARLIAAYLLALPLTVFGANYFFGWFDVPTDDSPGGQLLQTMRDGGLMSAIAFSHVVVGILLVIPRTRFLSAILQLPVSIGIISFHVTMLPEGNGIAAILLLLNLIVLIDFRKCTELVSGPRSDRRTQD